MSMTRRVATVVLAAAAVLAVGISAGSARAKLHHAKAAAHRGTSLNWQDCGDGYQCANLEVPRDYRHPHGATFNLGIIRLPAQDKAHRIGSLFVNFGGPGGDAVDTIHAIGRGLFGAVNDRFDIVAVDPRGVTETQPSVDCHANQETQGIYSEPFTTPLNLDRNALIAKDLQYIHRCEELNGDVLRYLSTKNTAMDMDAVRAAMGEPRLNYFGFSYGTFLGSTYASLFPNHYRAMVLDGPVDVDGWINRRWTTCASSRTASSGPSAASSRPARPTRRRAASAAPTRPTRSSSWCSPPTSTRCRRRATTRVRLAATT
jgi:pimeloyl-ACP methyl ester carboxylesterase